MRQFAAPIVFLALFALPAAAEEAPRSDATQPLTTARAADQAVEALASKNPEALTALAAQTQPDPWAVADLLCARGKHDVAQAFSVEAPRPVFEGLERYVASRRDKPDDATARKALSTAIARIHKGDVPGAHAALEEVEGGEDTVVGISILFHTGLVFRPMRRLEDSSELSLRAARAAERWGWFDMARRAYESAAIVQRVLGNSAKAVECYERALHHATTLDVTEHIADAALQLAYVHHAASDHIQALPLYERVLVLFERLGRERKVAATLNNIGRIQQWLGDYAQALAHHDRALKLYRKLGDLIAVAGEEVNIGIVHAGMADYAKALEFYELGMRDAEKAGKPQYVANALNNIGGVYWDLGDAEKAREYAERALKQLQALGDRATAAATIVSLGMAHAELGDHERARAYLEKGLSEARAVKVPQYVSAALGNLAREHLRHGENEQAVVRYEEALELARKMGDRVKAAHYEGSLGFLAVRLGQREEGISRLKRSIREGRRLRARPLLATNLRMLARIHLDGGDAGRALYLAREALGEVEHALGGLGEDTAAHARSHHAELFAIGALAASRLDEPAEVVTFLESGRAGALLESLGGRKALRWTDLTEDLRRAELEAKRGQEAAQAAYQSAVASDDLAERRAKAKALDAATLEVREVAARIQREAKGQAAGFFYPRAATIEEIQGTLTPGQALVLYGLCLDEALALVLTRQAASQISLGTAAEITAACEAMTVSDADGQPGATLSQLAKLLVAPLSLPAAVTEVIVSPEGPLCYVPFGALFEQPVALAPSGTTHTLLVKEEHARGTRVLALGDPVYGDGQTRESAVYARGRQLRPLPFTHPEAMAVGDEVLLGAEASEAGLRKALVKSTRWRAVHFACHGLVDPERPTLSSLALSRTKEDDGFLTALEVLRMDIPTDLAVLSACETGKGKIVRGEGILGLTRAFMYAGAPRVLCSLWKVDDEATRALMVKFYELWSPRERQRAVNPERGPKGRAEGSQGLGAAEALKKAQAFVRSHEKWKHPYYWAAWVLWGLP